MLFHLRISYRAFRISLLTHHSRASAVHMLSPWQSAQSDSTCFVFTLRPFPTSQAIPKRFNKDERLDVSSAVRIFQLTGHSTPISPPPVFSLSLESKSVPLSLQALRYWVSYKQPFPVYLSVDIPRNKRYIPEYKLQSDAKKTSRMNNRVDFTNRPPLLHMVLR